MNHGRAGMLPADEYVASLARKRMAAGALFRDRAGGVLLVDPVYRDTWDLPGGAVEAEESSHAACRREVAEELGLDRPAGLGAVLCLASAVRDADGKLLVDDSVLDALPRFSGAAAEILRRAGTGRGARAAGARSGRRPAAASPAPAGAALSPVSRCGAGAAGRAWFTSGSTGRMRPAGPGCSCGSRCPLRACREDQAG